MASKKWGDIVVYIWYSEYRVYMQGCLGVNSIKNNGQKKCSMTNKVFSCLTVYSIAKILNI